MKKLLFLVTVLMLFSCSETRRLERSLNSLESNVFTREQLQSVGLTVSMLETLYNGSDTMTKEQETELLVSDKIKKQISENAKLLMYRSNDSGETAIKRSKPPHSKL